MKIELKKISFSERLSEETNAFAADLHINGKKVGYCKNDGRGGCTFYHGYDKESNVVIAEAEKYFLSLPKVKAEGYNFEYQPTLETAIDDQFELYLKSKEEKKMQKLFSHAIVFGKPNGNSYRYYNYKRPLSEVPIHQLKSFIVSLKNKELKEGENILNTNLAELGINV